MDHCPCCITRKPYDRPNLQALTKEEFLKLIREAYVEQQAAYEHSSRVGYWILAVDAEFKRRKLNQYADY